MKEKDLNRVIVSSLKDIGFAHKISDDAQNFTGTSKKPFDYFAVTEDFTVYGESKFIKGIYSFNFNRLEEHQIEALTEIATKTEMYDSTVLPVVSIGFWEPHKFLFIIFFHIKTINSLIDAGTNSIKKKELERIIENGKYLEVKKNTVQHIELLSNKVINNDIKEYID